jgi:hypothetical protein
MDVVSNARATQWVDLVGESIRQGGCWSLKFDSPGYEGYEIGSKNFFPEWRSSVTTTRILWEDE